MKKVAVVFVLLVSLLATSSAQATFQGGGKKPSEAATIEWGRHYVAELDNHKENANYLNAGGYEVSFWRVPAVSTRDQLVVNWQSVPTKSGSFPVYMYFVQGVNDSNGGELFERRESAFELSGSGTAASQDTETGGNSYLEFVSRASTGVGEGTQETFQYNFTVEQPRHYLSMAGSRRLIPGGRNPRHARQGDGTAALPGTLRVSLRSDRSSETGAGPRSSAGSSDRMRLKMRAYGNRT